MAATSGEPVQPIFQKTCILRASIHCQGCKRKVKKILTQVQGVEFVDVDIKQHKVTVTGDVDADTLIKKLAKSGKNAELWPQKPPEPSGNGNQEPSGNGNKEIRTERNPGSHVPNPEPAQKPQPDSSGGPVKTGDHDGGSARTNDEKGGGAPARTNDEKGGAAGAPPPKPLADPSPKTNGDVFQEEKIEKKSEESCSESVKAPEKKEAVLKTNGGGGESGASGKKKKKKGQSGNLGTASAPAPPAQWESENQESGPPPPTNYSPPRSHHYPHPNSYYAPPPQPVCAVSYNTAYPTSSYTTSYYAAPPPYSYAYMHPVHVAEPPPSDAELNPRQPLDSFEIFSDENPNGCFIM